MQSQVLHQVAVLRGKQPEDNIFPRLLEPLPVVGTPKPTTKTGNSRMYLDATHKSKNNSRRSCSSRSKRHDYALDPAPSSFTTVRAHPLQVQVQPTTDAAPCHYMSLTLLCNGHRETLFTTAVRGAEALWSHCGTTQRSHFSTAHRQWPPPLTAVPSPVARLLRISP